MDDVMGNRACRGIMAVVVDFGRRSQRSDWTVRRPDPAIERQDQGSPALVHVHHHWPEPFHPRTPRRKMDHVCDIGLVLNGTRGRQEGSSIVRTDRLPCNIRTGVPIATEKNNDLPGKPFSQTTGFGTTALSAFYGKADEVDRPSVIFRPGERIEIDPDLLIDRRPVWAYYSV
jgi:hypothetical protein